MRADEVAMRERGMLRPGSKKAIEAAGASAALAYYLRKLDALLAVSPPQIFVDLDGVLADFDTAFEQAFGYKNDHNAAEPADFWPKLAAHADGHFYADLPLMPDAMNFWAALKSLHRTPIILTGIPHSLPHAEPDKRAWVAQHFGADVQVICCASKDKCKFGKRGDILIDDWQKYRSHWEDMGGVFVLHTSNADSFKEVQSLLAVSPQEITPSAKLGCRDCLPWELCQACKEDLARVDGPQQLDAGRATASENEMIHTLTTGQIGYLRELETHLAAMQITLNNGAIPSAQVACAREIISDVLLSFGLEGEPLLKRLESAPVVDAVARPVGATTGGPRAPESAPAASSPAQAQGWQPIEVKCPSCSAELHVTPSVVYAMKPLPLPPDAPTKEPEK